MTERLRLGRTYCAAGNGRVGKEVKSCKTAKDSTNTNEYYNEYINTEKNRIFELWTEEKEIVVIQCEGSQMLYKYCQWAEYEEEISNCSHKLKNYSIFTYNVHQRDLLESFGIRILTII